MENDEISRDEIIEMAKEARLHRNQHNLASNPMQYRFSYDGTEEALMAFAKLVSLRYEKKIADLENIISQRHWDVLQEREACAFICDELHWPWHMGDNSGPKECAEAIRARGEAT